MKKRILALAAALTMCLAIAPLAAYAAGETVTLQMENLFAYGAQPEVSIFEITNVIGEGEPYQVSTWQLGDETESIWDEYNEEWFEQPVVVAVDIDVPHYLTAGAASVTLRENRTDINNFNIFVNVDGDWEMYAMSMSKDYGLGSGEVIWENLDPPEQGSSMWLVPDDAGFTLTEPGFYRIEGNGGGAGSLNSAFYISVEAANGEAEPPTPPPTSQTVSPTAATVLVDGTATAFEAYNIDGYNFFKLRDLAHAIDGSGKQFSVGWDGDANAISLTSGQPYEIVGGEMEQGDGADKAASPTTSTVFLDGRELSLTAYNIGGNNFFRLRDLMSALDIGVTWDGETSTIGIDTSISYSE